VGKARLRAPRFTQQRRSQTPKLARRAVGHSVTTANAWETHLGWRVGEQSALKSPREPREPALQRRKGKRPAETGGRGPTVRPSQAATTLTRSGSAIPRTHAQPAKGRATSEMDKDCPNFLDVKAHFSSAEICTNFLVVRSETRWARQDSAPRESRNSADPKRPSWQEGRSDILSRPRTPGKLTKRPQAGFQICQANTAPDEGGRSQPQQRQRRSERAERRGPQGRPTAGPPTAKTTTGQARPTRGENTQRVRRSPKGATKQGTGTNPTPEEQQFVIPQRGRKSLKEQRFVIPQRGRTTIGTSPTTPKGRLSISFEELLDALMTIATRALKLNVVRLVVGLGSKLCKKAKLVHVFLHNVA